MAKDKHEHKISEEGAIGNTYVIHCSCGVKGIGDNSTEALQAWLDHVKAVRKENGKDKKDKDLGL